MNKKLAVVIVALAVLLAGCTVPFRKTLDSYLTLGQYQKADALIEKEKKDGSEYKDKNEILYYFDKGSVTQMLGDYGVSNGFLNTANEQIELSYTRSVVDEANSFLSNDLSLKYSGEDFEQVMVNIMTCLNYMYEGKFDDARIEAKKVNNKLNLLADTMGDKAIYTDDAFARYLSAFCYEAKGDINDAYIDYKKSLQTYEKYTSVYGMEMPEMIKQDFLRTATALKFKDDIDEFTKANGEVKFTPESELNTKAEVLIVVYDGLPAYKIDSNSWPKFVERPEPLESVMVTANKATADFYVAQDISKMGVKNLELRVGQIMLKKVASSVVKQLAKQVAILSLFVQDDKADTRSWRTIPARFRVARLMLEPGKTKITVTLNPAGKGAPVTQVFDVNMKKGEKKAIPVFFFR